MAGKLVYWHLEGLPTFKQLTFKCRFLCKTVLEKDGSADLKLVNNGCKGRRSSAAVLQQVHASVVVADIGGENQELCFSG